MANHNTLCHSGIIVLLISIIFTSYTCVSGQATWQPKADVIFVLDSSDTVGAANYATLKNFMSDLVQRWNIGPNDVQVSVVSYGQNVNNEFDLDSPADLTQLQQQINGMPFRSGNSDAADAFKYAHSTGFTSVHGARKNVPHIIIHITDKPSIDRTATEVEAQKAFDKGVVIYNVGIGEGTDPEELKEMTSEPHSRYLLKADTYSSLKSLIPTLESRINNEVPISSQTLPASTSCLQKADLVFIVDSSSSVGQNDFHHLEDFLKDSILQLPVASDKVRVGLVQFANHPSLEFSLDTYTQRISLLKAVDSLNFMGGGTNTGDAIQYAADQVFSSSVGARYNVPHIAVVITDGHSTDPLLTTIAADTARQQGISLIAVGVGHDTDIKELENIANDPDSGNVFQSRSYKDLKALSTQILNAACNVTTVATAPPTLPPGITTQDPCQDKLDNCNYYPKDTCTSYVPWAKENCKKYCGYCQVSDPEVPCDDDVDCGSYGTYICTSADYAGWARTHCPRYCGFCAEESKPLGYYGKCFYKGVEYSHSEKWVDGCDYECVCEDGETGAYRCYNRCPVYENLPTECTLISVPNECCLQPVCDFKQKITTTQGSGKGINPEGIEMCEYGGLQYYDGQSWDVGCDQRCTCTSASTGTYICQSYCPTYDSVPSNCHLVKKPGQCCYAPVCEFQTLTGTSVGFGTISGRGIGAPAPDRDCVDELTDCKAYGKGTCKDYPQWASQKCALFCDACVVSTPAPKANDKCLYDGKSYLKGDVWNIGCDLECTCEIPAYGYYRCDNKCPTYSDVPSGCKTQKKVGECCPEVVCSSGNFNPSATNLTSVGNGGGITLLGNNGTTVDILPTLPSNVSNTPVNFGTGNRLDGCLFQGRVYIQGQQWHSGCDLSCVCMDAAAGKYECRERCPKYENVPSTCTMKPDPRDPCCTYPTDCGQTTYVPIPVFPPTVTNIGAVMSPSLVDLTNGHFTTKFSVTFSGITVKAPTTPSSNQGNGFCLYKGQRYMHGQTWEDGCDYNCVCEDGSTGSYRCVEKCEHYYNLPTQYCHLETDPFNPCCQRPVCNFTAGHDEIIGQRNETLPPSTPTSSTSQTPSASPTATVSPTPSTSPTSTASPTPLATTVSPTPPTKPPTTTSTLSPLKKSTTSQVPPKIARCFYKGKFYYEGQAWYDGCDYKCTCDDADTNVYSCLSRCPQYTGNFSSCAQGPDPRDPACCSMPMCGGLVLPPGEFTGIGMNAKMDKCMYKGVEHSDGDVWEDGCNLQCECTDSAIGLFKCVDKCPTYTPLPPECKLVPDFANPCCEIPQCSPGTTLSPVPVSGPTTVAPPRTECQYYQAIYYEGQTWDDGCELRCRCENDGLYRCEDRCPSYENLPSTCHLVASDVDPCCKKAECTPSSTGNQVVGTGLVPTLPPKKISGTANVPQAGQVPTLNSCVYKGQQHQQGDKWDDGCDFVCQCDDATTGKYTCTERCPAYYALPPQCQLVKDASNPCCSVPVCDPSYATPDPNTKTTLTPGTAAPVTDVCVYKGKSYTQGQAWYDGCQYSCVCEDSALGIYRCSDRCPQIPSLPQDCSLTADPADPLCCEVPVCNPKGNQIPTLAPAVVTGRQVTPSPLPTSSPQIDSCIYGGVVYRQGQRWTDGCDYNCVCDDGKTGHYTCTEICPQYGSLPPQCVYIPDPSNPCCRQPYCDPSISTPATASPQSTIAPGFKPGECVYNGVSYYQGSHWNDGCELQCICEDSSLGKYRCDQRCPQHSTIPMGCQLATDTDDACCQMVVCPPNSVPTAAPLPYPLPYPIPAKVPGKKTGQLVGPNNTGCLYKGKQYTQGDTWDDGCEFMCKCLDDNTGVYDCTERCIEFFDLPQTCQLVQDPADVCCKVPKCAQINPTPSPMPGGNGTTMAIPPKTDFCVYNGQSYTQDQVWYNGCAEMCQCEDARMNYSRCKQRCPEYTNVPLSCVMVPDPNDPACCQKPDCGTSPGLNGTGFTGKVSGYGTPPTTVAPSPGSTVSPPTAILPTPSRVNNSCLYKGVYYSQGQKWRDGCDYNCECIDGSTGKYECLELCPSFLNTAACPLERDPLNPCCLIPNCSPTAATTQAPGMAGSTIPFPTPYPILRSTVVPQKAFCVYNGVPYKQYDEWTDGCNLKCRCEDAVNNQVNCDQRCPTYANLPAECSLVTDPSDQCCQVPSCIPTPGQIPSSVVNGVLGTFTGKNVPGSNPIPDTCVYHGSPYQQDDTWVDACLYNCTCVNSAKGEYACKERCMRYPNVPQGCVLIPDPKDACCELLDCPDPSLLTTRAPPMGVSTVSPGLGNPTPVPGPSQFTAVPPIADACVYNGQYYRQGQIWYDGCSFECSCDNATNNYYTCRDRCKLFPSVAPECVLIPDPDDPSCCVVPSCNVLQPGSVPTPGPILATQAPGKIVGIGKVPTPAPYLTPGLNNGTTPSPPTGCVYKGVVYKQNDQWADACDWNCECTDESTGQYECTERCAGDYYNLPSECVLVQNPSDSCCKVPYCDFINPSPFPNGIPTLVPGQKPINMTGSLPGMQGRNDVCVYKGSFYTQGESWTDGCDSKCVCDNAQIGLYTCIDRCASYYNLPSECKLVTDPNDQCCLVPSCSPSPNPQPSNMTTLVPPTGPSSVYVIQPNPPATFTGKGGTPVQQPGSVNLYNTGYSNVCLYNGKPYQQGQDFDDGCEYKCTCVDALKGEFRCTERCAKYENLPADCKMEIDVNDICCQVPRCFAVPPSPTLTNTTIAVPNPVGTTTTLVPGIVPSDVCVYNRKIHVQGDIWQDDLNCAYQCQCNDALRDLYTCGNVCPIYAELPSYCSLVADPSSQCCKKPNCVVNGTNVTSLLPFGTVNVIGGSPGRGSQTTPDGKKLCTYNGQTYAPGENWFDGCDLSCSCDESNGFYTCVSRCPSYSKIPTQSNCKYLTAPGQCCSILSCNITGYGTYNPVPQIGAIPQQLVGPSPAPGQPTPNPQVWLVPGIVNTIKGNRNNTLPGGGYVIPTDLTNLSPVRDKCLYNNKLYNQGEKWSVDCDLQCECMDAFTGFYTCSHQCARYNETLLPLGCSLVQSGCCRVPQCIGPDGSVIDPVANPEPGLPVVGVAGTSFSGSRPTFTNQGNDTFGYRGGCIYKSVQYKLGDVWNDGCDKQCECKDADLGFYECMDMCQSYQSIPSTCHLVDQQGKCCKRLECDPVPTPASSQTSVSSQSPSGSEPYDPNCHDNLANCKAFGSSSCQDPYKSWAKANCPLYCGVCTPSYTTTAVPCVDLKNCKLYGANVCTNYIPWAETNCRKFCGFCGSNATPPPPTTTPTTTTTTAPTIRTPPPVLGECDDKLSNCREYGDYICTEPGYTAWVVQNCASFCGLCKDTSTPSTPSPRIAKPEVCVYNNKTYMEGETWIDGCAYNCSCVNGTSGRYICSDLCPTYPNLPSDCTLIAKTGECCSEPICNGVRPVKSCYYKGVDYSEGAQWIDGCDFDCTCLNGTTGIFRCSAVCPRWQLPAECVLEPPGPGMCCRTPKCPFNWMPPANYVPR